MIRWCLAAMLLLASAAGSMAESNDPAPGATAPDTTPSNTPASNTPASNAPASNAPASNALNKPPAAPMTLDQISADAARQSIGAPARADLGPEAAVRLHEDLLIVPHDPAVRLLTAQHKPIPASFVALITAPGLEESGHVRFIPSGFIDSNEALPWTPDDVLDSLQDTVKRENQERAKQNLEPLEARRWIRPPHYDPDNHLLSWAALILPASSPRDSDGQIIFHGVAFGRDGYIELTVDTSEEAANTVGTVIDTFLLGVAFNPGRTYADFQKGDPMAPKGLAGAMGIDTLHKLRDHGSVWSSDIMMAVVGGLMTLVGTTALFFYIQRYLRRRARRV
jgi:uncharacterized membrane-anchored protein